MKAYQLKITIKNSHPPIWRRIIVPAKLSFSQLGVVLNEAMGWCGYHMFAFEFPQLELCIEELEDDSLSIWDSCETQDAAGTIVEEYLDEADKFTYIYDFGDNWEHQVLVEKRITDYEFEWPTALKIKGDTPYEDCGGIWRYYDILRILQDPEDPEYEEMKEWTDNHFTVQTTLEELNRDLKRLELKNITSAPMLQSEIYEDIMDNRGGFRRIRGDQKNQLRVKEPHQAREGKIIKPPIQGGDLQEAPQEWKAMQQLPQDWTASLRSILESYNKTELVEIAKRHCIPRYSQYKKAALITLLCEKLLDREVMCRYFMYLSDEELKIIDDYNTFRTEKEPTNTEIMNAVSLILGGYCGALMMNLLIVPREVEQAYRKNCDSQWHREHERVQELWCYANAAAELYGICSVEQVLELYREHTGKTEDEEYMTDLCLSFPMEKVCFFFSDGELVNIAFQDEAHYERLKMQQQGKPYYVPTPEEVECLGKHGYLPFSQDEEDLKEFLGLFFEINEEDAEEMVRFIQNRLRIGNTSGEAMQELEKFLDFEDDRELICALEKKLEDIRSHTRLISLRGAFPASGARKKGQAKPGRQQEETGKKDGAEIIQFPGR